MAQAQQSMDLFDIIKNGADRAVSAVVDGLGAMVGFTAQHAPGAIGATFNAGAQLAGGINEAVRDASASITPSAPTAGNPFAGLNLGGALEGLRGCSIANDNQNLGELASPLANLSQMRSQGHSMSM